ncbi:hypothetical protein L9F63_018413, partial [Diploptera punctata]
GGHLLRELEGLSHFPRRTRSGLDSLSGATFGDSFKPWLVFHRLKYFASVDMRM